MKTKKIPMRRCVGCMESKPKRQLIRIVASNEDVEIDLTGKSNGRGVYLCPNVDCFAKARKKRAINRSLDLEISNDKLDKLYRELEDHEKKDR